MDTTYYRKGFGLKREIQGILTADYHSNVVEAIKANDYVLEVGHLTFRLAREFGFCYGVDRAVEYAYYPPIGKRGVSPNWPNVAGVDWNHVIQTANQETVLIVQIESVEAFGNLEEIAAVPGIDVLFIGPMDMSASLGAITQMQDPRLQEMMKEFPKILAEKGIPAGTTLADIEEVKQKLSWGYRFMNVGNPMAYGVQALNGYLAEMR